MKCRVLSAIALIVVGNPVLASGVSQYQYDTRGRLVRACRTTPSSGLSAAYGLDQADNRTGTSLGEVTKSLGIGDQLYSPNGQYRLVMQGDGNLVLYGPSGAAWSTSTWGTNATVASFQSDGNLVVYGPSGALWSSQSNGNYCSTLAVEDSGRVGIYAANGGVVWTSN